MSRSYFDIEPRQDGKARAIIESIAHVLARDAKYNKSHASMIVCSLATELRNYLSDDEVNELFADFQRLQRGLNG